MAVTFSLTSTGLTTIDFTSATDFVFQDDYYVPVVITPTGDGSIPPYVTETLPVMVNATTDNDLALTLQELAALQKRAAEYWVDQQQAVPVLLNCKLDAETTGRQALVKAIHFEWKPSIHAMYRECSIPPGWALGTVLIERHPYWERTATRTFPNATPAAAASVAYDYTATADIVGDVPARINALTFYSDDVVNVIQNLWMGIRSTTLHGADGVTNFDPVWELEDAGALGTDVTVDAASDTTNASPGGGSGEFIKVIENIRDWDAQYWPVCTITLADVGYADYDDAAGRFLLLLRGLVTAGEWSVYARAGLGTAYSYADPISITSTVWQHHELALPSIPAYDRQSFTTASIHPFALYIYAKRISGAGNLWLDCVCPIPIDEGFCKISNTLLILSSNRYAIMGEGPHGHFQAMCIADEAADYDLYLPVYEWEALRLPPGDGRLIIAYSNAAGALTVGLDIANAATSASTYTERWSALRGAE